MADRLKTFTEEEKRLAEKNHDLVYQFLRAHNYSMEDYYNIVVFGYLKGIQKYCRYVGNNTENNLDGICWNCMRSEIVPLNLGGADRLENIQIACFACNQLKKNILPEDFLNRVTNVFMYQMEKKCRHNLQWKCIKRLLKTLG